MGVPIENPIINSPYLEPAKHWELDAAGQPTGEQVEGRRPSMQYTSVALPKKGSPAAQSALFDYDGFNEFASSNDTIAMIRQLVADWRRGGYQNITPTTRRLLEYWSNENRSRRLFFAQIEAVETAIYLTEVGTKLGKGWIGEKLAQENSEHNAGLPRIALKMATGSGKTVVMAMLISWQVLNKVAAPQDKRFTKKFLLVAPGITIRDRLRVLQPSDPNGGYYMEMDLVPSDLRPQLGQARIAITNFHSFMLKTTKEGEGLAANTKKLLLGGYGSKRPDPFVETPAQMVNRVLRDLGGTDKSQIIVINDEAHHCYQTRSSALAGGKTEDQLKGDEKKEAQESNKIGRQWFDGLRHIAEKVGVKQIYDLSATPSYLTGSGYPNGLMFPWVVSDFSLLDAIESGLVKIPRVPVDDDATQQDVSYLNLWRSIPEDDRKRLSRGTPQSQDPLPAVLHGALTALYRDYEKAFRRWEDSATEGDGSTPPVFIVVCANTKISKWVYDKIAGFEVDGQAVSGVLPLFSNYKDDGTPEPAPRTIIVDSVQLESDENSQLSTDFKQAAAQEIEVFHEEYLKRFPDRNIKDLSDKDLLREVLNTVGKPGKLGQNIRCVVSVSMLTEGWDANTVTHILGIRAFGSHLLCEQVVGRGLRRVSYDVNAQGLFDPEYAEVFGVPFQLIQTSPEHTLETKPRPIPVRVQSLPERTAKRIVFPNLEGYRVEIEDSPYYVDFSTMPRFVVDETLASISTSESKYGQAKEFGLQDRDRPVRPQEIAFRMAGDLLRKVADDQGAKKPWLFPKLVILAKEWIKHCLIEDNQKALAAMLVEAERARAVDQLFAAMTRQQKTQTSTSKLMPIFQRYAPAGSTDVVDFFTTKARYATDQDKSPVNYVVLDGIDGNTWEEAVAQHLESMPGVESYVKNDHLEFRIPYTFIGRSHWYVPDFIVKLKQRDSEENEHYLIVEVSGDRKSQARAEAKARTARDQWCAAVNNHGGYGIWGYTEMKDPNHFRSAIKEAIRGVYSRGEVTGLYTDALLSTDELDSLYPTQDGDDALFRDFFITQTAGSGGH